MGAAEIAVVVQGVTPTQAIVSYTAPSDDACRVEVSESSVFSTLVHDVDPALFSGAGLDSALSPGADLLSRDRPHSTAAVRRPRPRGDVGGSRVFVVGKRDLERGLDGRIYSRALQAATPHYVRVTCRAGHGQTQFLTSTVPFGDTYSEGPTPDPDNPGAALRVSSNVTEHETIRKPANTGSLPQRQMPIMCPLLHSVLVPIAAPGYQRPTTGVSPAWPKA
jgi:hypothetical protein